MKDHNYLVLGSVLGINPARYSVGPEFECRPSDQKFCLEISQFFNRFFVFNKNTFRINTSARSYSTDNQLSSVCNGSESKMSALRVEHRTLRKESDDNATVKDASYIIYERSP